MKKILSIFLFIALFIFTSTVSAYTNNSFATTGTNPFDAVTDSAGNLYVTSYNTASVTKITPSGVSSTFATTGTQPYAITIDQAGNLYTADNGDATVTKIDPTGVSSVFATTDLNPQGIVIDGAGNIYTANAGSNTVTKITPLGASSTLGTTGIGPRGITLDSSGNIYTGNILDSTVTKITPGGVSAVHGTTDASPRGIAIDGTGNIYTANYGAHTVTKITPSGVSSVFATTELSPTRLVIDSSNTVYVANYNGISVSKISPSGVVTRLGSTNLRPLSIIMDQTGNIYTVDTTTRKITKFSAPVLTEITPVSTPTTDTTPDYVFDALTDIPNTLSYGGSCSSPTTEATLGSNTITFNDLLPGTYSNCTITVTDSFGASNVLAITSFTISGPASSAGSVKTGGSYTHYGCKDPLASNYEYFAASRPSLCMYGSPSPVSVVPSVPLIPITPVSGTSYTSPIDGTLRLCPAFTAYLKRGSQSNDVLQVLLWQSFLNAQMKETLSRDGIFGRHTESAVKRFQSFYADAILAPWNISVPTGYVYTTTRAQANKIIGCSL